MANQNQRYNATLVRGQTYTINGIVFTQGKPVEIDTELKQKLEKSAIDRATLTRGDGEKEVIEQQKFKFVPIAGSGKPKVNKADELLAMQGDGGVDFEDDDDLQPGATDDEEFDDEDEEEKPVKAKRKKGPVRRRR